MDERDDEMRFDTFPVYPGPLPRFTRYHVRLQKTPIYRFTKYSRFLFKRDQHLHRRGSAPDFLKKSQYKISIRFRQLLINF